MRGLGDNLAMGQIEPAVAERVCQDDRRKDLHLQGVRASVHPSGHKLGLHQRIVVVNKDMSNQEACDLTKAVVTQIEKFKRPTG